VDDRQLGLAIRTIRVRRGWRQVDVADRTNVPRSTVGQIERGRLGSVRIATVRQVAATLDARLDLTVRWHGGDLGRLINARHAAMHEGAARLFAAVDGWAAEPEVSVSVYWERGIVDVLGWHPTSRIVLVVELKTELVDLNDLMGTLDRKRRLAPGLARDRGWDARAVASWVIVADTHQSTGPRRPRDRPAGEVPRGRPSDALLASSARWSSERAEFPALGSDVRLSPGSGTAPAGKSATGSSA
jgi:transcriptional regulator with XRE-family HTH domain